MMLGLATTTTLVSIEIMKQPTIIVHSVRQGLWALAKPSLFAGVIDIARRLQSLAPSDCLYDNYASSSSRATHNNASINRDGPASPTLINGNRARRPALPGPSPIRRVAGPIP